MRWYQKDRCARSHRFRPAFNLYTERLETRLAMSTANAIFSGAIAPTAVEAADAILSTPVPGADRSPASETSAAETAGSTSPHWLYPPANLCRLWHQHHLVRIANG